MTGIGAGGAQFMVISTGQGHTLSNAVIPTINITGNPGSAERVPEETDVDVSEALVGDESFEWATDQLWDKLEEVVNGKVTLSEALGESQFASPHRSLYVMEVDRGHATEVAANVFRAYGISDADAVQTAEVLVSADTRGKHSHGLLRLPRFVRDIEHGNVDPEDTIEVTAGRGGVATISGGSRLGSAVASDAVGEAMDRADEFGVGGVVGVHDSNHLGMLGYYTDQLQRGGYVGIAITNTEPAMPPYGRADPVLGTNPVPIGLPTDPAFNLDMSTSAIARGEVLHREETGESLPEHVALDSQGEPTTDPAAALEGVILPFGGPKGSGLAIAIEVLAGGLVGAELGENVTGTYHTEDPCRKGDLFLAFNPETFGVSEFHERSSVFLQELTEGTPATHTDKIRLLWQHSVTRDQAATTVDNEADLWETVQELAADY